MVPGVPLHLVWSDCQKGMPDEWGFRRDVVSGNNGFTGTPDQYIQRTPVDVLILQVFPDNGDGATGGTLAGAVGFAGCAYQSNPNCQVYIYPSHNMTIGAHCDMTQYTRIYEPLARAITTTYPSRKPALVIPVLHSWNQMLDAGYTDLWSDGHANNNGKYILITTFYATIYKSNPLGAITSNWYGTGMSVTSAFATKAQQVAWSVVNSYPLSGVGGTAIAYRSAAQATGGFSAGSARAIDLSGRQIGGSTESRGVRVTVRQHSGQAGVLSPVR